MKNTFINIAALFVIALTLTVAASAQMSTGYKAEVPFDFAIGNKTFAAGEYRVELANPRSKNGMITIRNAKTQKVHVFNSSENGGESPRVSKLVFSDLNGVYFLEAISTPTLNAVFPQAKRDNKWASAGKRETKTIALKPSR